MKPTPRSFYLQTLGGWLILGAGIPFFTSFHVTLRHVIGCQVLALPIALFGAIVANQIVNWLDGDSEIGQPYC